MSAAAVLPPQNPSDRKIGEPLIWTGCFVDKSLAPARMCNPGSSSLYPLHYTDNATQTPTLSPLNSDLNLICVPAIYHTSILPSEVCDESFRSVLKSS